MATYFFDSSALVKYYVIEPGSTWVRELIIEEAADLTQHHLLKAYDAVQLAVALRQDRALAAVKRSLVFVSGDKTLSAAAQAEGLVTDNPFDHVSPEDVPRPASPAPPAATL